MLLYYSAARRIFNSLLGVWKVVKHCPLCLMQYIIQFSEVKFIKIDSLTLPYPPFAWPTFTTTGNLGVISCNKKVKQEI